MVGSSAEGVGRVLAVWTRRQIGRTDNLAGGVDRIRSTTRAAKCPQIIRTRIDWAVRGSSKSMNRAAVSLGAADHPPQGVDAVRAARTSTKCPEVVGRRIYGTGCRGTEGMKHRVSSEIRPACHLAGVVYAPSLAERPTQGPE